MSFHFVGKAQEQDSTKGKQSEQVNVDGLIYKSPWMVMHSENPTDSNLGVLLDGNHRREAFQKYAKVYAWPSRVIPPLPALLASSICALEVLFPERVLIAIES